MNRKDSYTITTDFIVLLERLLNKRDRLRPSYKDRKHFIDRMALEKAVRVMQQMVPGMDWANQRLNSKIQNQKR